MKTPVSEKKKGFLGGFKSPFSSKKKEEEEPEEEVDDVPAPLDVSEDPEAGPGTLSPDQAPKRWGPGPRGAVPVLPRLGAR